jgi:hypothetical protein
MTTPWTPEEDSLVIQKFHQIGPKWVEIGKLLSGRSGNNVKNRWHKHLCGFDIATPSVVQDPPPVQKPTVNLAQAIGWNENDWLEFFGKSENPMQTSSSWKSGSSVRDVLF